MGIRYVIVEAVAPSLQLNREEKTMCPSIYASGLPAFVMSQLPLIYDSTGVFFENSGIYPDLAMPMVLGTVIYSNLAGQYSGKHLLTPPQAPKEAEPEEEPDGAGEKPVDRA